MRSPRRMGKGSVAVVDHDDLEFAAIVGVDGAGRIGDGDAVLEREARAGADLDFIAFGDGDAQAGGDRVALAGGEVEILGRDDVHAGGVGGGVGGQGQAFPVGEASNLDADHARSWAMRARRARASCSLEPAPRSSVPSAVRR